METIPKHNNLITYGWSKPCWVFLLLITCTQTWTLLYMKSLYSNFIKKKTPVLVFHYEFCEIFKNIFWSHTSVRLPPYSQQLYLQRDLVPFTCKFSRIFQSSFFYRTSLVIASFSFYQHSETYLEPCQTSKADRFCKNSMA